MSLNNLLSRLQDVTTQQIQSKATHTIFVLRAEKTSNNKGGTTKVYEPTTTIAYDCISSPVKDEQVERERMRAGQRRPGLFHKFVLTADVDVKSDDKIRRNAIRGLPELDMEIIRVTPKIGLALEVIAFEESPLQ